MASNETNHEIDGSDILDTLKITDTEMRTIATGCWVSGSISGHDFEALIFDGHAENPAYELEDSFISKLWIRRISDRAVVANFDRGWDIQPTTPVAQKIVGLFVAGLAYHVGNE